MHTVPSFEERFHEFRAGPHWRLWRDVRCAVFILGLVWRNLTVGRRVRRKYLDCVRTGAPFWLDEAEPGSDSRDIDSPTVHGAD